MNAVRGEANSPRIALVAGETSSDNLGAALIEALREHWPHAQFVGIAGPRMQAAGCVAWETIDSLAVMGIFEIIPHLRRLLRVRRELIARLLANPPDVYIGVDYKEFNLSVERKLKAAGIRTVQYVSPQVWAWRQGRVRKIARAVDLMLCLLPFEKPFYDAHGVRVRFVGHPLADQIPLHTDRIAARVALKVPAGALCLAVLPGSRQGEVMRLGQDFAQTIVWLKQQRPDCHVLAPMANARARELFAQALQHAGVLQGVQLLDGQAQQAMIASDVVLLASGTATLEAALLKRPMVVAYRLGRLTIFLLNNLGLMKSRYFSQPNLLADKPLVPEFYNEQVRAEVLGPAILTQLDRPDRAELEQAFMQMHQQLKQNASQQAALAIKELLMETRESDK
ncbi:MAG: lipid-A-disaccharide synthase [Steroidobacteraceae bacterium]